MRDFRKNFIRITQNISTIRFVSLLSSEVAPFLFQSYCSLKKTLVNEFGLVRNGIKADPARFIEKEQPKFSS